VSSEFPIEVRSSPLSPTAASFSIDLRQLLVTFNQNIDGQSCEELFTGTTKRMFGSGKEYQFSCLVIEKKGIKKYF